MGASFIEQQLLLSKPDRSGTYLNNDNALMNVWVTPQARGMPTNNQATASATPELGVVFGPLEEVCSMTQISYR